MAPRLCLVLGQLSPWQNSPWLHCAGSGPWYFFFALLFHTFVYWCRKLVLIWESGVVLGFFKCLRVFIFNFRSVTWLCRIKSICIISRLFLYIVIYVHTWFIYVCAHAHTHAVKPYLMLRISWIPEICTYTENLIKMLFIEVEDAILKCLCCLWPAVVKLIELRTTKIAQS